jgi:hypothetical protein
MRPVSQIAPDGPHARSLGVSNKRAKRGRAVGRHPRMAGQLATLVCQPDNSMNRAAGFDRSRYLSPFLPIKV